jgi:hypothetical protein
MNNKFKIGDIVANKDKRTIGIVLDNFEDGDYRTDADGVVCGSDLEILNFENHLHYHCSPSTFDKISKLFKNNFKSLLKHSSKETILKFVKNEKI